MDLLEKIFWTLLHAPANIDVDLAPDLKKIALPRLWIWKIWRIFLEISLEQLQSQLETKYRTPLYWQD